MAEVKPENKKSEVKEAKFGVFMAWLGWGIIFTTVVFALGFYYGSNSQAQAQADTKAAVEHAIHAVTPAAEPSK